MAEVSVTIRAINQASPAIKTVAADLRGLDAAGKQVTTSTKATAASLGDLEGKASGLAKSVGGISGPVKATSADLKELESAGKSLGGSLGDAGGKLATFGAVAGGALAAGIGFAVKKTAELETSVAKISTIKPDIDTSKVTKSVEGMSTRVAQSTKQLGDSLYNVFSSIEVSQEGALALTEKFARGAVAAQTDAETFGTSILGVMNAYKLSVSDADHVSDVFFSTVNKGVVSGEELARGLGNVTQSAKNAGVNFDTLGALIAGVTKEGGEASVNINNLNNMLQKLVTSDVQEGLQKLGVETRNADGSFRDILPVLEEFKTKLDTLSEGDRAQALQNLFPDQQARTGMVTLLSQLDNVTQYAKENASALGVADDAYKKMGDTAAAQATILKNTLLATVTQFGAEALPTLVATGKKVQGLAEDFGKLPSEAKRTIVVGAEVAAVFLLVGSGAIKAATGTAELAKSLYTVGVALNTVKIAGVGLTSTLAVVGAIGIGLETTIRQATGGKAGILDTAKSLITYGDAWGFAREEAQKFLDANKDQSAAFEKRKVELQDEIKLLDERKRKLQENSLENFLNTVKGPFAEGPVDVSAQANAKRKELEELIRLQDEATKHTNLLAQAQKNLDSQLSFSAARDDEAAFYAGAASGANQLTVAVQGTAAAIGAAAQAARADDFAHYSGEMSNARTIAASLAESQKGLADQFASQSAAMQGVTATVGPLQGAFDLLNQKVAAGIPLSSEQQHLLATLPGYIAGATSGYDGLVTNLAQTTIAQMNANRAAGDAGTAFGGLGGQASSLQGYIDNLRASTIELEGALGALGSENSKLAGYYGVLEERVTVLQEKQKEGAGLSAAEAAELGTLQSALVKIGDARGMNAVQMRDYILGLLGLGDETKNATGKLNDFGTALGNTGMSDAATGTVGLTDGLGNVATASENAKKKVDDVTAAVNAAPKTMVLAVSAPGANEAALAVQNVGTQVNNVPTSFTVTAHVDISQAVANINTLSNMIPRSPAKEGPFRKLPNWRAIYEGLKPAGAEAIAAVTGTTSAMAGALKAAVDDGAKQAADIASAVAKAIGDVVGSSRTLARFDTSKDTPSADQFAWLGATTGVMVRTIQSAAKEFEEKGLDAAGKYAETTGKIGGSIKGTLEGLAALAQAKWADISPSGSALGWYRHLATALARTFVEASADFETEGLEGAGKLAETTGKIGGSVKSSLEGLAGLASAKWADISPSGSAMGWYTHLMASLAANFVAASAKFEAEGLEAAGKLGETSGKIGGSIGPTIEGLRSIAAGFPAPSPQSVDRLVEAIGYWVRRFGELAKTMSTEGVKQLGDFSDATGKALSSGKTGIELFKSFDDKLVIPSAKKIDDLYYGIKHFVGRFREMASEMSTEGVAALATYADATGKSLGSAKTASDLFKDMEKQVLPTTAAVDALLGAMGYVIQQTRATAVAVGTEGMAQALAFAADAQAFFGSIKNTLEIFPKLADHKDKPTKALTEVGVSLEDALGVAGGLAAQADALKEEGLAFLRDAEAAASAFEKGLGILGGIGGKGGGVPSLDAGTIPAITPDFAPVPGRALGGPVMAGQAYEVGERGREYFIPRQSGTIVPGGNFGGGGGTNYYVTIHVGGSVISEGQLVEKVRTGLLQKARTVPTLGFN